MWGTGILGGFDALSWGVAIGASRSSVEDSSRFGPSGRAGSEEVGLEELGRRSIALALGWEGLLSAFEYPAAALVLDLTP